MGGDYANGTNDSYCGWLFPGVTFAGNSRWYLIQTSDSYNGLRVSPHGNFIDWFAANAFGSTHYENTPVGAVSHVFEPGGVSNDPALYFGFWAEGKNFGTCAWGSIINPSALQPVGDPLVKR